MSLFPYARLPTPQTHLVLSGPNISDFEVAPEPLQPVPLSSGANTFKSCISNVFASTKILKHLLDSNT